MTAQGRDELPKVLSRALEAVADWRREALGDHVEFARRDRLLGELEHRFRKIVPLAAGLPNRT